MATTRSITLVRHGKSSWLFPGLDDHDRPLGARGRRDCERVPAAMSDRVPAPERVLCSDSARTVATCEAVAAGLDIDGRVVEFRRDLYLADAETMLALIAGQPDEVHHVMLVGHNPGLTDLYNELVRRPLDNLPTFAVAHLGIEADRWRELERRSARVHEYLVPKKLR